MEWSLQICCVMHSVAPNTLLPVLLAVTLVTAGCGAQIQTTDGKLITADIVGQNKRWLYYEQGDDQDVFKIPKRRIARVKHPGKAATVIGIVLMALGTAAVIAGGAAIAGVDDDSRDAGFEKGMTAIYIVLPGVFVLTGGGITMVMGLKLRHDSRNPPWVADEKTFLIPRIQKGRDEQAGSGIGY